MRAPSIFYGSLLSIITILGLSAIMLIPAQTASADITGVNIQPTTGQAPLVVSFGVTFTGQMKSIDWHFGDASSDTMNQNSTTHTYSSAGNYTGTVEVITTDGQSSSQSFQIAVTGMIGGGHVGENATVPNPHSNSQTAYQYFQQEHNGSLVSSSLPPLIIATDSLIYGQGDSITINGAVKDVSNSTAVTIRIINPLKNMVSIDQFTPNSDGSFKTNVMATGPLWTTAGNYTIIAQYGPYTNATAYFTYSGGNGKSFINKAINATYSLKAGQLTFDIPYTIRGGTLQSIQPLPEQSALAITINAPNDGSISMTLPRGLIDSKEQPLPGQTISQTELPDKPFSVQIGGKNVQFTEAKNLNSRTLGIPFSKGDTTIDVVGTVAVPEFGTIAALVFAIAIISIVAVSAKTGLRFMPNPR